MVSIGCSRTSLATQEYGVVAHVVAVGAAGNTYCATGVVIAMAPTIAVGRLENEQRLAAGPLLAADAVPVAVTSWQVAVHFRLREGWERLVKNNLSATVMETEAKGLSRGRTGMNPIAGKDVPTGRILPAGALCIPGQRWAIVL